MVPVVLVLAEQLAEFGYAVQLTSVRDGVGPSAETIS